MSAVIDSILDVKAFREDRASTVMRKARYALEEAARLVEQREHELEEYRSWRIRRESEMYDEIETRVVQLRDLEELKEKVGLLRSDESLYQQKINDAEQARHQAKEALDEATDAYHKAMRGRQKFEEVSVVFEQEERLEQERQEELELEDVRPMSRFGDDEP